MKEKIRIASGQGFWGDLPNAPIDQITKGPIDYLVLDYLAEVTMSILQKQKLRDSKKGFATDFVELMKTILSLAKEKNVKIISNAGGVNPIECAREIEKIAREKNIKIKIGIVFGDDILNEIENIQNIGIEFKNLDTGENISSIKNKIVSANVYFGADGIVEALKNGAECIITGRVTDAGMTLAPLIYEFGWDKNDYDKLASGIVAGHILECGAQSTGGNCSLDWETIPDLAHVGFPIVEAFSDGTFFVTKHKNSGGRVSVATVSEQLVYEIGDPKNYITPDCITDFTSIELLQVEENVVKVFGVKGNAPTEYLKISMAYADGFRTFGTLTFSWPNALKKAKLADEIIRKRVSDLGLNFEEIYSEFVGFNSTLGKSATDEEKLNEVLLRIGAHSHDEKSLKLFLKQIPPIVLTGPPGVTGYLGALPKPMEVFSYWPTLIPKNLVEPKINYIEVK